MVGPDDVLRFWLDECEPKQWYVQDDALDQEIRDKFMETWEGACAGRHSLWLTYPNGALAYIILMDQFPRNMFRGSGKAFACDRAALAAAHSIEQLGAERGQLPLQRRGGLLTQGAQHRPQPPHAWLLGHAGRSGGVVLVKAGVNHDVRQPSR